MSKGRVYIVENPLFPTLFKIGFTTKDSVEKRGLNASNLPEPFDVIREYECADCKKAEKLFLKTLSPFRYYDRRGKKTEFFSSVCLSTATALMDALNENINITDVALAEAEAEAKAEEKAHKNNFDKSKIVIRRPVFDFYIMGIPKNSILLFVKKPNIQAKVFDNKQVKYKGKLYSFSRLTAQLLNSQAEYVQPCPYWSFQGRNLHDIYNETYPKM